MVSKDLTFRLFGEDSTASASLRRLSENADRAGSRITNSVGRSHAAFAGLVAGVTSAGLGLAGAAIGAGFDAAKDAVVGFARTGIGEVMDASAGMAQLAAGIKSTGGVAGVSVGHMEDLASSLQSMSGQTDDSIVSAEQLLLTFTNIRNSGPDKIFDQATRAAADMAAKMGGDASSKAIMLGKALNDPVKGMSALQRVGVSFTASQKNTVAAMVRTGNVVGAQKIILGEMTKEFGGAAKAAGQSLPGQLERLKRGFEDMSQSVMEKIIPVVRPAIEKILDAMKQATPFITAMAKGFGKWAADSVAAVGRVMGKFGPLVDAIRSVLSGKGLPKGGGQFSGILTAVKGVGDKARDLFKSLQDSAKRAEPSLRTFGKQVLPKILEVLRDIMPLLGKFGRLLADLAPVLIPLGRAFGWVVDHGLKPLFSILGNVIDATDDVVRVFNGTLKPIDLVKDALSGRLGPAFKANVAAIKIAVDKIKVFGGALHDAASAVGRFVDDAVHNFDVGRKRILDFFGGLPGALRTIGRQMVDGLSNGLRGAWDGLVGTLHDLAMKLPEPVRKALGIHSPSRVFHEIGRNIGQGLQNGLLGSKDQIQAASNKLADAVVSMFQGKEIGKSAETRALAVLHSGTKQLEEIAKKRAIVATKLKAAQDTLKTVLSARKDYAAGVKSSTVQAGDVSTLGSAGDMVQHLSDLVAHTRQFRTIMRKLVGKGIDQTTYGELVQAGVAGGGLEAAQSLLANPIDLRQVVSLQRQLGAAAGGLGADSSTHVYASAVGRDRGRVGALNHLDTAYARQQRSIAASTVRRVERDVHVHINLSGHLVGSETALAKTVVKAIRDATRSGAISKDALKV